MSSIFFLTIKIFCVNGKFKGVRNILTGCAEYKDFVSAKADSQRYLASYWIEQEKDKAALNAHSETVSNINVIRNNIRLLTGHQRAVRKQVVLSCDSDDIELQKAVDYYGFALGKGMQRSGFYEALSKSFEEAISFGISALFLERDASHIVRPVSFSAPSLLFDDSFFDHESFAKCDYIGARTYISKTEAYAAYPDQFEEIKNSFAVQLTESNSLGRRSSCICDYLFRKKRSTFVRLSTPFQEWIAQKGSPYHREVIQKLHISKQEFKEKEEKHTVPWVQKFINGVLVEDYTLPELYGRSPITEVRANIVNTLLNYNFQRVGDCIQGVARELRDLQAMMGRVTGSIDAVLDASKISGFIYRESSVSSESDVNSTDKYGNIPVTDDVGAVTRLAPQELPPSYTQFLEQIITLTKQSGVNEELFGVGQGETALTTMLRQSAGLITLNKYFDNLDESLKTLGKTALCYLLHADKNSIRSITKQDPPPESISENEFLVEIEEGMDTDLQKRRRFSQLLELHQMGILEDKTVILESAPLQQKGDIIETLTKQDKQRQQEAQQEAKVQADQLEMQNKIQIAESQADIQKKEADAMKSRASVEESKAKVLSSSVS